MVPRRLRRVTFRIVMIVLAVVGIRELDGWLDVTLCSLVGVVVLSVLRDLLAPQPEQAVPQDLAAGPVVRIDDVGARRIEVIKSVRGATSLGLVPVKTGLDELPARFVVRTPEDADALRAELERRGAVAVVEPPGSRAGFGV